MPTPRSSQPAVLLIAIALLPGCASIMSGRYAEVTVASNPPGAHVAIHDDQSQEVASFHSPGVAKLKRNRKYLMPGKYVATIEAPGYQTARVPIRSTANPWLLANIVIGGIPGHGNRILFRGEIEEELFEDIGGEAGAVPFAADVVFDGSVRRQDGHCQSS